MVYEIFSAICARNPTKPNQLYIITGSITRPNQSIAVITATNVSTSIFCFVNTKPLILALNQAQLSIAMSAKKLKVISDRSHEANAFVDLKNRVPFFSTPKYKNCPHLSNLQQFLAPILENPPKIVKRRYNKRKFLEKR